MRALLLKELRIQLFSVRFFLLLAAFTLVSALSFFSLLNQFNPLVEQAAMVPNQSVSLNELVIEPFWSAIRALLLFLIPILSMKSFAAEREEKTIALLLVSPVSSFQIAFAKLVPLLLSALIIILVQFSYPIMLWCFAPLELAPALMGGFGAILIALSYMAVGGAVSAFCKTQILAGAFSFLLVFAIHSLEAFSGDFGGALSEFAQFVSPNRHLINIERGLIKSSDIAYFLSLILLSVAVAAERLELERGA